MILLTPGKLSLTLSFFCLCALSASTALAQDKDWRPISPAELAAIAPVVEAVMSRTNSIYLPEKDRKHPVMLESNSFREKATFNLPAGFIVDEVPNPVSLQTTFGKYATTYEVKDGKLIFTRSLTLSRSMVGVERYKDVRDFFTGMLNAEQSPVVLIRK